jgi:hypothetical protein
VLGLGLGLGLGVMTKPNSGKSSMKSQKMIGPPKKSMRSKTIKKIKYSTKSTRNKSKVSPLIKRSKQDKVQSKHDEDDDDDDDAMPGLLSIPDNVRNGPASVQDNLRMRNDAPPFTRVEHRNNHLLGPPIRIGDYKKVQEDQANWLQLGKKMDPKNITLYNQQQGLIHPPIQVHGQNHFGNGNGNGNGNGLARMQYPMRNLLN